MGVLAERGGEHCAPHVLVVCEANQCRSTIAEHLMRRRIEALGLTLTVGSAGVHAESGLPAHPLTLKVLHERGIDATNWRSRRLEAADLVSADLVLVAERRHLVGAVELQPSAARRTLPILQFAHLTQYGAPFPVGSAEQFAAGLEAMLALARSRVAPMSEYDIADPISKGRRGVKKCADLLDRAVREVLAAFTPATIPAG